MSNILQKLTCNYLSVAVLVAITLFPNALRGQDSDKQWFAASVVLDDAKLSSFRQSGFLKIPLPQNYINHIDAVVLKRPNFFKDEKATEFPDAERMGSAVQFGVDETALEQIEYQPVEFRIYESDFNTIVIQYLGGTHSSRAKLSLSGSAKRDSPVVRVRLTSGKEISGRIRAMKVIPVDAVIGDVDIKMNEVSMIEVDDSSGLAFSMLNGDTISGEVNFEEFELLSRWGTEIIELKKVSSIQVFNSMQQNAMPMQSQPFYQQQPMYQQPLIQQPMYQQPSMYQPAHQPMYQPMMYQPAYQQPYAPIMNHASPTPMGFIQPPAVHSSKLERTDTRSLNPVQNQSTSQDNSGTRFPWSMQPIWSNPTMSY